MVCMLYFLLCILLCRIGKIQFVVLVLGYGSKSLVMIAEAHKMNLTALLHYLFLFYCLIKFQHDHHGESGQLKGCILHCSSSFPLLSHLNDVTTVVLYLCVGPLY
jgi:hypothetical protein